VTVMATCWRPVLIVVVILIRGCSASLPVAEAPPSNATPTDWPLSRAEVTEPVRGVRSSSGTRPACRLLATDPYLSNRVRQMAADGRTHLIKYTLQFPDGSSSNVTGSLHYCLKVVTH